MPLAKGKALKIRLPFLNGIPSGRDGVNLNFNVSGIIQTFETASFRSLKSQNKLIPKGFLWDKVIENQRNRFCTKV